jgi:hypothetical protein
MGSILKATLFGGIVSFVCIILGFKFIMPLNGQILGFNDPSSVKNVLESNSQNSGLYMIPDLNQEAEKFSNLEKNIEQDAQSKSFKKEDLPNQKETVALITIQKGGLSFASWQKLAILLMVQIFFAFEVSLITIASISRNYFYNLLLNNLTGWLQICFLSLLLIFFLGFPSTLVSMVAIVFAGSWMVSSIFTSIFTRKTG